MNGMGWRTAGSATVLAVVALLLVFHDTAASMVKIWHRSETFAHGFLIFPIAIYLIWRKRRELAEFRPMPDWRALPLLLLAGIGWCLAYFGSVLVFEQYALIAMIPLTVWAVLGWRVAWHLAFPLGYLLLAVPVGEALIPPLMEFTADFTVAMLQLTGIPVYREGTFFMIPGSQWSVIEECSGIRYLIASLTLGTLYGYLTYRSNTRRVIFALLSIGVPILANGFRAYMIVMIAHLSDMKLALGVDHYIYGWAFFGLVMLLLFWIGAYWREDDAEKDLAKARVAAAGEGHGRAFAPPAAAALAAVLAGGVGAGYAALLTRMAPAVTAVALSAPAGVNGWQAAEAFTDWQPRYLGMDAEATGVYEKDGRRVVLHLKYYRYQRQDAELVNSQNVMIVQKHERWHNVGETVRAARYPDGEGRLIETRLRAPDQRLLVWHWNWLDGTRTVNPYVAKLVEARTRFFGGWNDAAGVIIATPYDERPEQAAATLQAFIQDMLPAIEATLDQASGS